MKVLVTGAGGQLGYDICKTLEKRGVECCGVTHGMLDITDANDVLQFLVANHPDGVIHCAAYTAVDKAEAEPELARAVNTDGTRNVATACKQINAKLLYISTDYVFPGMGHSFYETDDVKGPLGVYGQTKLDGEAAVRELMDQYFIVRISWVFGKNGNNFVKTMLRLAETHNEINVVCDQMGSPTYTCDLAPLLCDMIETDKYGIYHATNEGICSWADFAVEIFRQAGKTVKVRPVTTAEYGAKARRPLNSRMSKKSLDNAELQRLPTWQDALNRYLKELDEKA